MNVIHETAVIDEGLNRRPYKSLAFFPRFEGAQIGADCSLGQNVFIGRNVEVGNNCRIQNNVSVYENVVLADDVFLWTEYGVYKRLQSSLSDSRKDSFSTTVVGQEATLGANCTIVCGISIGVYAFVGAGAVVKQSVRDYALVVGVPATQIGWMSRFGEQIPLPLSGTGSFICPHTGENYSLTGDRLRFVEP